jgi:hypothetical protein
VASGIENCGIARNLFSKLISMRAGWLERFLTPLMLVATSPWAPLCRRCSAVVRAVARLSLCLLKGRTARQASAHAEHGSSLPALLVLG